MILRQHDRLVYRGRINQLFPIVRRSGNPLCENHRPVTGGNGDSAAWSWRRRGIAVKCDGDREYSDTGDHSLLYRLKERGSGAQGWPFSRRLTPQSGAICAPNEPVGRQSAPTPNLLLVNLLGLLVTKKWNQFSSLTCSNFLQSGKNVPHSPARLRRFLFYKCFQREVPFI